MSQPKWIKNIEKQVGKGSLLLVEGNTDVRILGYFLNQVSPNWDAKIVMRSANRKSQVIEGIKYRPEWVGIVDKDEWAPTQIASQLQNVPRVKTLPRFCIENYFCVPEELWVALPPTLKQRISNDLNRLKNPVLALLPDWVAHGAMWRVIRNRRRGLLYESDFPAKLDNKPVTELLEIRQILEAWHDLLDPDQIMADYQQELMTAQKLTTDEQLKVYIHGKKFFKQVMVPTLNTLFGQARTTIWLERFMEGSSKLAPPPDLQSFLEDVLKLF